MAPRAHPKSLFSSARLLYLNSIAALPQLTVVMRLRWCDAIYVVIHILETAIAAGKVPAMAGNLNRG